VSNDDHIIGTLKPIRLRSHGFSQPTLHSISSHRSPNLSAHRDPNPALTGLTRLEQDQDVLASDATPPALNPLIITGLPQP